MGSEGFLTPVRVFEFEGFARDLDLSISRGAVWVLILCFLVSLGLGALQRFENYRIDVKIYNLLGLSVAIGLWPHLMDGIGHLVDVMNGIALRAFGIEARGLTQIGDLLWEVVGTKKIGDDYFVSFLSRICAFMMCIGRYALFFVFLIFYFFFKLLGPFVLARGILAEDFSVFKALLSEVTLLFLWQTTFVFLVGFALKTVPGVH